MFYIFTPDGFISIFFLVRKFMSIYNTIAIFKKEPQVKDNNEQIPSRKLTYPTWGKGKSSSTMPYQRDMLIPWRVYQQHQRYPHHASKISGILFHATNRRCHHGKKVYIHNFEFSLVPTSCLDLPLKRKHVTTAPPRKTKCVGNYGGFCSG